MLPKARHIIPKWAWLWSRDWFKILLFAVMQRVTSVRRRELSYLFVLIFSFSIFCYGTMFAFCDLVFQY